MAFAYVVATARSNYPKEVDMSRIIFMFVHVGAFLFLASLMKPLLAPFIPLLATSGADSLQLAQWKLMPIAIVLVAIVASLFRLFKKDEKREK